MIQVKVIGDKELLAIFTKLVTDSSYRPAMSASSEVFIGFAKVYPSQSKKKYPFVSEKQRRFVIIAIRKGLIQVPYVRRKSGGLSGAWTYSVQSSLRKLEAKIDNAMPYGHWVMHTTSQAQYHQNNWPTTDAVMDESIPQISAIWQRTMDNILGARI